MFCAAFHSKKLICQILTSKLAPILFYHGLIRALLSLVKGEISKAMKGNCTIKKLNNLLLRKSLITIYKSFVRAHLIYGDLIYDQPNNKCFCQHIESVKYNTSLAIISAIRGTSGLKLYNETGLESLICRRRFRKLCTFYKIKSSVLSSYLFDLIPKSSHMYNTRSLENVATIDSRTDIFKYLFFRLPYQNGINQI